MSGGTDPLGLTLNAAATAGSSGVTQVEFFLGDSLLGSDATAPYSLTARGVKSGTWSLVAVATDAYGLKAMSEPVTVTLTATSGIREEKKFRHKKAKALEYGLLGRKLKPVPAH